MPKGEVFMSKQQQQPLEKKPYDKPKLRTIELKAEEVLGTGCKMTITYPASGGGLSPGCAVNSCTVDGS